MSVILNVAFVGALDAELSPSASLVVISVKTQFLDQGKIRFTSQLINGTSEVLQKLPRRFNETGNLTSVVFQSLGFFPVILFLYLKDSEFVIGSVEITL